MITTATTATTVIEMIGTIEEATMIRRKEEITATIGTAEKEGITETTTRDRKEESDFLMLYSDFRGN